MQSYLIGLDIAQAVFQVHGEDAAGRVVLQRRLRRAQVARFFTGLPSSLVALEAGGSAPYWGRRLQALGHEVRLIPAAYVRPFVRRNKTDARDAAAICAALKQPDMRFVRIKCAAQQAARGLERTRELLVRQHTQLGNSVRGQLAAHGLVAARGRRGCAQLIEVVAAGDARIPAALVPVLQLLLEQSAHLAAAIAELEARIVAAARSDPAMRRLATIPGIVAHAMVAAVGDGRQFRTARDFAAWAGLTPQEHASAGKRRTQGISRQGDSRLRKLFALGASTVMRTARAPGARATAWQRGILARAGRSRWRCWRRRPRPRAAPGPCWSPARSTSRSARRAPARPPRPGALAGATTTAPAGGKEQQHATAKWSGPGPGHSASSSRLRARRNARSPVRATHRGPRSSTAANRPDT